MVMISTQVSELDLENVEGQLTQLVVLPNITWQTYRAMLADTENQLIQSLRSWVRELLSSHDLAR